MTMLEYRRSFLVAAFAVANGPLYGGTRSELDTGREKQKVFKRRLSGRGYRVLS